jgi:hypothetical protein
VGVLLCFTLLLWIWGILITTTMTATIIMTMMRIRLGMMIPPTLELDHLLFCVLHTGIDDDPTYLYILCRMGDMNLMKLDSVDC